MSEKERAQFIRLQEAVIQLQQVVFEMRQKEIDAKLFELGVGGGASAPKHDWATY